MTLHLLPKVRSSLLTKAVRRYPCSLRVSSFFPGHICAPQDTVVGCHVGGGGGMGTKATDLAVVAGCLHCHDIIDGRDQKRLSYILQNYPTAFADRVLQALIETQARLVQDGIITVKGDCDATRP
jgi:hypothetical protein